MNNFFVNIFFQVLNWSPILHASIDSQFGSIDQGYPNRFSLFGLSLGKRKFYIFSLVKTEDLFHFNFFDHLNFDSMCEIKSESDVNEKADSYQECISEKSDDLVRNQIEFLKDKISMNQSRTSSGYNKTNSYTAIVLVYMGFIAYLLGQVTNLPSENILSRYAVYILIFLAVYYAYNCTLFIKSALSIKGYTRSKFQKLKENSSVQKLASAYYTDWYSTNNESQVITSVVANIEKYFTRSFVMSLSVWIILFMGEQSYSLTKEVTNQSGEYLIFNRLGEFQTSEFIKLIKNVNEGSEKIFIVSNSTDKNGLIVSDFIKSTLPDSDRVIEISFKNSVVDSHSVIIKHKE
jgi:hypothetical protein